MMAGMEPNNRQRILNWFEENVAPRTLNFDCLVAVMEYLPPHDRIRVERVSKTWRDASLATWPRFKIFNATYLSWTRRRDEPRENILRMIDEVYTRCSKYIQEIHIDDWFGEWFVMMILSFLKTNFPNVRRLVLHLEYLDQERRDHDFYMSGLFFLIQKMTSLRALELYGHHFDDYDNHIKNVINARQLRHFGIEKCGIKGDCLEVLSSEHLEQLDFVSCKNLNMDIVLDVIKRCKNLHSLKLSSSLTLRDLPQTILLIETFKESNITHLDLSSNITVDDTFLMNAARSFRKLKKLNISGCNSLTDKGLKALHNLPRLEYLFLRNIPMMEDVKDLRLPKLKRLMCDGCCDLTDQGLISFFGISPVIEIIDARGCLSLTNEVKKFTTTFVKPIVILDSTSRFLTSLYAIE